MFSHSIIARIAGLAVLLLTTVGRAHAVAVAHPAIPRSFRRPELEPERLPGIRPIPFNEDFLGAPIETHVA